MICESCGMPLEERSISKKDRKYCVYCQNQETGELATKEQVRAGSVKAAIELMGKTKEEAEKMTDEIMPTLPRWQNDKV